MGKLTSLFFGRKKDRGGDSPAARRKKSGKPVSLIVTHAEISMHHGTGALLRRLLDGQKDLVVARSRDMFPENETGDVKLKINHDGLSRPQTYDHVLDALGDYAVSRILCVPFFPDEMLTAIAAHDLFGAPLCLYIMDDQNISEPNISDALMREGIRKSRLRFAISPQLRDAYEHKFGEKFWLLPPVVPRRLFAPATVDATPAFDRPRGILIGNLWSETVTRKFRETVAGSGIEVDWFGNAGKPFLQWDPEELKADGIGLKGFLETEQELATKLRQYDFAVMPSGTMDAEDEQPWLSSHSLPSRLMFIMASSNLPVVVLGSPQTAAAMVVAELGIGATSPYDTETFVKAVTEITAPDRREAIARTASEKSEALEAEGVGDWIWSSLEKGRPLSGEFDSFLPRKPESASAFVDEPVLETIHWEFGALVRSLRRLSRAGFKPDFVIDAGASTGYWSYLAAEHFQDARFVLIEPLSAHYNQKMPPPANTTSTFEWVEAAASDHGGTAEFHVAPDLYGSSLMSDSQPADGEKIAVPLRRVDEIAAELKLEGRGMLKADVQFAEHLVVDGAAGILPQLDAVLLELSLLRFIPGAKTLREMIETMDGLGFRYYDDAGVWRSSASGELLQKDVLFLRRTCPISTLRDCDAADRA